MSEVSWKKNEVSETVSNGGVRPRATLAAMESLAIPLVQEVVFLSDFRCSQCQQRVAEIMTRMNGDTQSVVISVMEKKVTLTYAYQNVDKMSGRQIARVYCTVMRINLDCNSCCRKMKRTLLKMKEIETYLIEKQQNQVSVCGRYNPADVAIKIGKKMKRRVEILAIQEFSNVIEDNAPVVAQNT